MIQARGVPMKIKTMFDKILDLLETPYFTKFKSFVTKKGLDSSLEIKKDYLKEALYQVRTTKQEEQEMKLGFLTDILSNVGSISKIFSGDFISGIQALARNFDCMYQIYRNYRKKPSWFDTCNYVMGLANENIHTIRNSLFVPPKEREMVRKELKIEDCVFIDVDGHETVTYFVVEMLGDIIKGTNFTLQKRYFAIQMLFLVGLNCYDVPTINGYYQSNTAHFDHSKDMRVTIIKLIDVIQFSITDPVMRKALINCKFKLQEFLDQNVSITKGKHEIHFASDSDDFYRRALENWNPITYALERMKNISDEVTKRIKPSTFIDIYCIEHHQYEELYENLIKNV
jgi:hypothetical protein